MRPEIASWRYGDQFGRRRTKHVLITGATFATLGGLMILGPATGIVAGGGWGAWQALNGLHDLYQKKRVRLKLVLPEEQRVVVLRKKHLEHTALTCDDAGWVLNLSYDPGKQSYGARSWQMTEIRGAEAIRVAGQVLPKINAAGASKTQVQSAVRLLEEHPDPIQLFEREARLMRTMRTMRTRRGAKRDAANISTFPVEARLALEMASHEEQERRALEGELAILEAAWRQAEEVAQISDDMFAPEGALEDLKRRG